MKDSMRGTHHLSIPFQALTLLRLEKRSSSLFFAVASSKAPGSPERMKDFSNGNYGGNIASGATRVESTHHLARLECEPFLIRRAFLLKLRRAELHCIHELDLVLLVAVGKVLKPSGCGGREEEEGQRLPLHISLSGYVK